ncbi:acyl-CoA synthetase [Plastoroseomonas arctica]|uniref:AMP-binding protein n=1 Tax=Plastoroseomonas arctica TaxID=1509237 RepID=A0AAF1JY58_9PROT|nr:AMP-binding protein [Plastoroseomonas arctica]MBR0653979.1 AMP-binding protein [Plastoroseomonas arctica]
MAEPGLAARLHDLGLEPAEAGRWRIPLPEHANITADTLGLHATGPRAHRVAVRFEAADGAITDITYAGLDDAVRRLATLLTGLGVGRGDRVAIHTDARIETVMAHLATYRLGAIATTLSQRYGPDTLRHALRDSGATVLLTEAEAWRPVAFLRADCPDLRHVLVIGDTAQGEMAFNTWRDAAPATGPCVTTRADEPALLVYTSGSTGQPKGVLHAHSLPHAYRPTIELFYDLSLDMPDAVLWTPADWGWLAALVDTIYPALQAGQMLVCSNHRFDPDWALNFMARHGVTHTLLLPTGLNRMAQIAHPRQGRAFRLRCIFTGGEPLPVRTIRWVEEALGTVLNEGYGMSEVNHMIGNCRALRPIRHGSMGWEYPGHVAALVDEAGVEIADGEVGEIVTVPTTPTLFLGYWNRPDLTAAMRLGPWIRTGDLAVRDADGYYWYRGRGDDLIKAGGARIGPTEIEDVLMAHPAVAEAAVIGVPDAERGQAVQACIRLAAGVTADAALEDALRQHVRERLGGYKAPRHFAFLTEMPVTSSGKVSRSALRRMAAQ